MKALTALPTAAYVRVAEEANVQLADLLKLVQELEAGSHPAYIARCRPHLSAGLDEERVARVQMRLQGFLDLEDRRITILSRAGRQNGLTPELRERIESVTDRRELEELYLPFRPRRRTVADEAIEHGLEPLAEFLRRQDPETADVSQAAESYVNPERGVRNVDEALRGARHIVARRLGEDAAIRRDLRPLILKQSEIVVHAAEEASPEPSLKKRIDPLLGYRAKVDKVSWRRELAIRQAVRDGALRCEVVLPRAGIISLLLDGLLQSQTSLFRLYLEAAVNEAYAEVLAPAFRNEVLRHLEERSDTEAVRLYENNLRDLLLTPAAGPIPVIGLGTGRSGGWRAAVVNADGSFVEGAIVSQDGQGTKRSPAASSEPPADISKQAASAKPTDKETPGAEAGASDAPAESLEPTVTTQAEPDASMEDGEAGDKSDTSKAEVKPTAPEPSTEDEPGLPGDEVNEARQGREGTAKDRTNGAASQPIESSPAAGVPPDKEARAARPAAMSLHDLISKHNPAAIAVANGPGVRQLERALRNAIREAGAKDVFFTRVSDAGTRAHATSKTARKEFPGVDTSVRSAAGLARRLQDPLGELVKVEPRALGLGPHIHTVDPNRSRPGLRIVTGACVSRVGVDINTAPAELLALAPALTERIAKRIVEYRESKGPFARRDQLRKIPGLSERIYRQAIPFLRVRGGENLLDETGVSPRAYPIVEKMLSSAEVTAAEAIERPEALDNLDLEEFADAEFPVEVLRAIVREFKSDVRDPRGKFEPPQALIEPCSAAELKVGMKLEGVVTNVTRFGAFVDIGAEQDGLLHISELSDKLDKESKPAVKAGDRLTTHIQALQENGKRISLSIKEPRRPTRKPRTAAPRPRRASEAKPKETMRKRRKGPQRETTVAKRSFGPDTKRKEREVKQERKLSLDEKLSLLETRFRTKI